MCGLHRVRSPEKYGAHKPEELFSILSCILVPTDICYSEWMIGRCWRVGKPECQYRNPPDIIYTLLCLVAFYVNQHNKAAKAEALMFFLGQTERLLIKRKNFNAKT
jgi:hypothetical protein